MREVTERPEGITAGVSRLVGTDRRRIVDAALAVLQPGRAPTPESGAAGQTGIAGREGPHATDRANPYGDGHAGERIADIVVHKLTGAPRRTEDWPGLT
jgi:UDP-N-acetylglucosamine 2-epimerase (non-hydrolysing)